MPSTFKDKFDKAMQYAVEWPFNDMYDKMRENRLSNKGMSPTLYNKKIIKQAIKDAFKIRGEE